MQEVHERIKEIRKHYFNDNNVEFANHMKELPATTSGWTRGKSDMATYRCRKYAQ